MSLPVTALICTVGGPVNTERLRGCATTSQELLVVCDWLPCTAPREHMLAESTTCQGVWAEYFGPDFGIQLCNHSVCACRKVVVCVRKQFGYEAEEPQAN